jgi:hypothetical protein
VANESLVSQLARRILRKGIGSVREQWLECSKCHRTPVPGEFIHRVAAERVVCSLCLAKLPESKREDAAVERVHASERAVAVLPRAA